MDDVIFSKTFKWVEDFMAGGGGLDRFGRIIVGIVNGFSATTTTTMAFRNVTDRQRNSRMGALFDTIVFTISCPHKKKKEKKTPISRSWCRCMRMNSPIPFLTGAATETAVSLHASGSLSNPLSLRVIVLNAPWVPLLSDPKLLRLRQSLDDRPGVGDVGGESQLIRRSGAVTDEVNGS